MRGKIKETQNTNSTPKPNSIPFKPSKSKSKSKSKSTPTPTPITNPGNVFNSPPFIHPGFTDRRDWHFLTTTVFSLSSSDSSATPWLYATVDGVKPPQLLHPLTLKPHHFSRPLNLDLSRFLSSSSSASSFATLFDSVVNPGKPEIFHPLTLKPHHFSSNVNLVLSRSIVTSFKHTYFPFDRLVIPPSRLTTLDHITMLVLFRGGHFLARLPLSSTNNLVKWVSLSEDKFDDIIISPGSAYVVARSGKLYSILGCMMGGEMVRMSPCNTTLPFTPGLTQVGFRKRLVLDFHYLYLVVRLEVKVFRVCKKVGYLPSDWSVIKGFDSGRVLFVSKDCCFFMEDFGRKEYENCIVFLESGFPMYGDDEWDYSGEDDDQIRVYRMSDGRYGKVGESVDFPQIDWSPPSWVFIDSEADKDGGVDEGMEEQEERHDSDIRDLESGKMQCDSNSGKKEDEQMQSNANIEGNTSLQEDVPSSLVASISALEEEVTRTLVCLNGGNEPTEKELSRKYTIPSTPRACTSSAAKRYKRDAATTKFEGYDIRSDLVPTLQKIWRNHGNIIESSLMRSSSLIANALELLATVVQILENDTVESLSEWQADYLSSTLSDLKIMSFNVEWLNSFVEKAIKLHKSKALVDSLNKLGQLSSQVKERKAIHAKKLAELTEEENKLESEMARVSKLIPFSGEVKLDEPFGSGLT